MTADADDDRLVSALDAAVHRATRVADRVELPLATRGGGPRGVGAIGRWSARLGWLAAGLVAGVLWTDRTGSAPSTDVAPVAPSAPVAHDLAGASAANASPVATEMVSARTIGELPTMMIDTTPAPGGGYEVVYLRRTLQKVHVTELAELAEDEHGNPTSVPIPVASLDATEQM